MLDVRDLHVRYGNVEAVRELSLTVTAHKITLVLGANGAGKTTTLRAIAGLVRPAVGTILMDGTDISRLAAHKVVRRGIVLVPEGRRIFAPLTVQENLRLGAYTASQSDYRSKLDVVYDMFPILRERRMGQAGLLSGGEQQMLAFGRGLMSGPRLMLMDEPSMGLAPALVESVLASVRTIADTGIGVLMVEQNADLGLEVADSVVVMSRGEPIFTGPASSARSHSSVVQALLGDAALDDPPAAGESHGEPDGDPPTPRQEHVRS